LRALLRHGTDPRITRARSDPKSLATLDVLTKLLPRALFSDANLLCLTVCRAVNLSLERGNSDGSCLCYEKSFPARGDEQQVKNIARPVRVYRVREDVATIPPPLASPAPLPLPDKPSIAVLPFANMSGDPEQEYFADGMVEEIITALSRIPWLVEIESASAAP
jgi:hypothetical protein